MGGSQNRYWTITEHIIGSGMSLSPMGIVMVKQMPDGKVKMVSMEYQGGELEPDSSMAIPHPRS